MVTFQPPERIANAFSARPPRPLPARIRWWSSARWNFIILNRFPYTNGHLMVVPYQHVATLGELAEEALLEMMKLAREAERALQQAYHPDGMNMGLNLGRSAGAGVAGHIHLHALPRWTGDVSFMTAVGETRVLPEDLQVTWERLSRAFGEGTEIGKAPAGEA